MGYFKEQRARCTLEWNDHDGRTQFSSWWSAAMYGSLGFHENRVWVDNGSQQNFLEADRVFNRMPDFHIQRRS